MRYTGYRRETSNHIWAIVIINLLVLIATFIKPDLIYMLGLNRAAFFQQPWTIVTNLFTHAGLWHILANMVTLYFFGSFITRLLGIKNFLVIYFCGGLLGNLFFLLLAPPYAYGIGASGAVFALGGALTVLTPRLKVLVFPIPVPIPLYAAVLGAFVILSVLPLLRIMPTIAWQAHLGGLVFGLLAGLFYRKRIRTIFY